MALERRLAETALAGAREWHAPSPEEGSTTASPGYYCVPKRVLVALHGGDDAGYLASLQAGVDGGVSLREWTKHLLSIKRERGAQACPPMHIIYPPMHIIEGRTGLSPHVPMPPPMPPRPANALGP